MLKAKQWRKIYGSNTNQKKAVAAEQISDQADFSTRKTIRDLEWLLMSRRKEISKIIAYGNELEGRKRRENQT